MLKKTALLSIIALVTVFGFFSKDVLAASNSTFSQVINPGVLSVDIVDGSYVSVGSPSVTFPATTFNFACQTNTGTFGTATQQIYVKNPDAADNGWTMSMAGSATTALWTGTGATYDFNDAGGSGCTDTAAGEADTVGGQMTVDASVGTLAVGTCLGCNTTSITKGSSASFVQGTTDSITLLNAAAGSSDIGDWKLTGVSISQKIPAEQPAVSDYAINMVLSIVAN